VLKGQSVVYNINALTNDPTGAYVFQPDDSNDPTARLTQWEYNQSQLSSISFPEGTINFITGSRDDLAAGSMEPLTSIQVLDKQGKLIKNIQLTYDYFVGDSNDILVQQVGASSATQEIPDAQRYKRLKLTGLKVLDDNLTAVQKYSFDYYSYAAMPSKFSTSQDHYGFYNGINNNGSYYGMIPKFIPTFPQTFKGGDRRINPNLSNAFALKSVTYPEGGKTELIYENNTAQAANLPKGLLNYYQDDNIVNKSVEINLSGNTRLDANLTADETGTGTRFFYKYFTIANAGFLFDGYGWNCTTNFGAAANEQQMTSANNNVKFALETQNGSQWVTVQEFNSHPAVGSFTLTNNDILKLGSGVNLGPNYRLKIILTYNSSQAAQINQPYTLNFKINYRELDNTKMMINVGGLRIKDINTYSNDGILATRKHFDYVDPTNTTITNLTSGKTVALPNYRQIRYQRYGFVNTGGGSGNSTGGILNKYSLSLSSQSSQPLETTLGSYAGYEYVTESLIDVNNNQNALKTVSRFSLGDVQFSQYYTYLYQGIFEPLDWTRGKLLSKQYYKGPDVLKSEVYTYYDKSPHLGDFGTEDAVDEINTDLISSQYLQYPRNSGPTSNFSPDFVDYNNDYISNGLFPWDSNNLQPPCDLVWYYGVDDYSTPNYNYMGAPYRHPCGSHPYTQIPHFYHYTGFDKIKSLTTTTYDGPASVTEIENYLYEKTPLLHQITSKQHQNSANDILLTTYKYPVDSSSTNAYKHMVMRHILDPVIEESTFKNSNFVHSSGSNYQQWADTAILTPVRTMLKVGSGTNHATLVFDNYDQHGNMLSVSKPLGAKMNYLWGYKKIYPIAQVKAGTSPQIAFTNCEERLTDVDEDNNGSNMSFYTDDPAYFPSDSHTGRHSFKLTDGTGHVITTSNKLPAGNYIFNYWSKGSGSGNVSVVSIDEGYNILSNTDLPANANGWEYHELKLNIPVSDWFTIYPNDSGLPLLVDDIRIHPVGSEMTTYTYDPMVGMTSMTDAKGMTTYYEYDSFKRLSNIKDKEGNIIKHFDYRYKNQ
jgi:hypothetical protein